MPTPKFSVGDRVLIGDGFAGPVPGTHEVTRVMPFERSSGYEYRVRRIPDGEQRVVLEVLLRAQSGA